MGERESLIAALRQKRDFIPDGFRDEDGVWHEGPHRIEFDNALALVERLRYALKEVLDAAERDRAGFPIESEEWYTRRDYARIQLEDSDG